MTWQSGGISPLLSYFCFLNYEWYVRNNDWDNNQEALKQELKWQIWLQLSLHIILRNICDEVYIHGLCSLTHLHALWCSNTSRDTSVLSQSHPAGQMSAENSPFLTGVTNVLFRLKTSSLLCSPRSQWNSELELIWPVMRRWEAGAQERVRGGGGVAPSSPSLHLLRNLLHSGVWSRMCWFLMFSFLTNNNFKKKKNFFLTI